MEEKKKKQKKVSYYSTLFIFCVILWFTYEHYQENNFNDFVRSESNLYCSEFVRDKEIKYSKKASYKIVSEDYNDAMFYKTIKVSKNQPYRVTCMVKTRNVEAQENISGIGAQISIEGTTERSVAVQSTTRWQKIELIFNSKNRETVNIGFRLGGYLGKAKGEAWFSDFTLEEGIQDNSNKWKFACFIFKTTDVNINGNQIKLQVTNRDIEDIKDTINRFERSAEVLSQGKMEAKVDVYELDTPLKKLSYDNKFRIYGI